MIVERDPGRDTGAVGEPRTEAGRGFVETVSEAVLDPGIAKLLGGDGHPQLVALVSVDAIRDAILAIEQEASGGAVGEREEPLREALKQADGLVSAVHDAIYAEPFDQKTASDAVWRVHEALRALAAALTEGAEQ